jgi:hypothetical protein
MGRYQNDILGYVHERLRIDILLPHQEAILLAIMEAVHGRARTRIAVRSGQKIGKTALVVMVSFWFYECFPDADIRMCAAIQEQTKGVLWKEIQKTLRRARRVDGSDKSDESIIPGRLAASPFGGFVSPDGSREIKGISGREVEALAGVSGNLLFIVDEASHLPQDKAEAFLGNLMGGGVIVWISNPTRAEGPFYEAFHKNAHLWQTFHVNSLDVARWAVEKKLRIPGIANQDTVDDAAEMFKDESVFWTVRVLGEFVRNEHGRAIPMFWIDEAKARHGLTRGEGPLSVGWDPAGPGADGDSHGFAVVRGEECIAIYRRRGLSDEEAIAFAYSLGDVHGKPGETVRYVVDQGGVGEKFVRRMKQDAEHRMTREREKPQFEVVGVHSASKTVRDWRKHEMVRDELVADLAEWMKTGAIPADELLEAELYAPTWETKVVSVHGQRVEVLSSTRKSVLREKLERSPDSFDALALAVRPRRVSHLELVPSPSRDEKHWGDQQLDRDASASDHWGDSILRRR